MFLVSFCYVVMGKKIIIIALSQQCLTTLPKEDQDMTLLENGKECLVSQDEMKVMITCNHTQCVAIQQQDQMTIR